MTSPFQDVAVRRRQHSTGKATRLEWTEQTFEEIAEQRKGGAGSSDPQDKRDAA